MHPSVEPPENVRVELADGTVIPCELVYVGWRDGVHQWSAVAPVGVTLADLAGGASIRLDKLPAITGISLVLAETP